MEKFEYEGIKLEYLALNNNKDENLIIIHGFSSDINFYKDVYQSLSKQYNIYGLNMPAHGQSEYNDKHMNLLAFSKIFVAWIEQLNLNNLILFGHSMGGGIAMISYPSISSKVNKIVLVGPMNRSSLAVKDKFKEAFFPLKIEDYEKLVRLVYYDPDKILKNKKILKKVDQFLKTNQEKLKYVYKLGHSLPNEENMLAIDRGIIACNKPIGLFYGIADKIIDLLHIEAYYKRLNNYIYTYKIDKSGHSIWIENKEEFFNKLQNFLKI